MASEAVVKSTSDFCQQLIWTPGGALNLGLHSLPAYLNSYGYAQQGTKGNLSTVTAGYRAVQWWIRLKVALAEPPIAKRSVAVFWAGSPVATNNAGDNPMGLTGANGRLAVSGADLPDYYAPGFGLLPGDNLLYVGQISVGHHTGIQVADVGFFNAAHQYGMPLVVNFTNCAFDATTSNFSLTVYPVVDAQKMGASD